MRLRKKELISKLKIGVIHIIDEYAAKQTVKELKGLLIYMDRQEKELQEEMEEEKRWKKMNKTKKKRR